MKNQLSICIPGMESNFQNEATMHNRPARGDKLSLEGGNGMTMQEIRAAYDEKVQVVYCYQGTMHLLLHQCFMANAKFLRESKQRHKVVFFLVESSDEVDVYRTHRGGDVSDYTIYVNKGEWQALSYFKTYRPARRTNTQGRLYKKYPEPSVKTPVIHAYPYAYDDEVVAFFSVNGHDMVHEQSYPRLKPNPKTWMPWHNYAMAIIRTMSTLADNDTLNQGIKELVFHNGQSLYDVSHTWSVLLGKQDQASYWDKRLESEFNNLKAKLQLRGITVSYEKAYW